MIYFDNAATTKIHNEVIDVMTEAMSTYFANPSSTHSMGRKSKVAIENARNSIAKILNCNAKEIIFTSGGTEADNAILLNAVNRLKVERIISSSIEHHAVLETIEHVSVNKNIELCLLKPDKNGDISLIELEKLLQDNKKTIVSLMHVNNETGRINDIDSIARLCKNNNAIFHSDTIQGISHFNYNLKNTEIDFICGSAHKFGGPKGIGFLYKKDGIAFEKSIFGGEQERNFRAGTENLIGIIGLQKAMEIAYENILDNEEKLTNLKSYLIKEIKDKLPGIEFNSNSDNLDKSVSNIVNIKLPLSKPSRMLSFQFDLKGIAISEGSACSSGNNNGSHVLREIDQDADRKSVRISFSIYNTTKEIDTFIKYLKEIL